MPTLLQQLENNEAILLMYLADELPVEDRAEVEQLLSIDTNLRGDLDRLRAAYETFESMLARRDDDSPVPVPEGVAVRRASRAIRQWAVEHAPQSAELELPAKRGLRYPWWSYPIATAAMLLLAFVVWWGNHSDLPTAGAFRFDINSSQAPEMVTFYPSAAQPLAPLTALEDKSDPGLRDVERQFQALADATDSRGQMQPW